MTPPPQVVLSVFKYRSGVNHKLSNTEHFLADGFCRWQLVSGARCFSQLQLGANSSSAARAQGPLSLNGTPGKKRSVGGINYWSILDVHVRKRSSAPSSS